MRIGIDGHVLGKNVGGVERFVRELVAHLPKDAPQHEYIVFVTRTEYEKLRKHTPSTNIRYVPLAIANPLLQRLIVLPWLVYQHQLDALLVQRLAPWFCGKCKLIATIHDLTPIKFADAYKGLSSQLVRLLTKNTIKRASLILTPTNAIKAEIEAYYPQVKAPIVAFYNGVDTAKFQQKTVQTRCMEGQYLLTVGAIERRKNIESILHMLPSVPDYQLAIVGGVRDSEYQQELLDLVEKLALTARVTFFGFTQENELVSLYQHATLFITASRDEGFNIPPLEAMACGTPVLCSDIAVHRELFANAAAFFEPLSVDELTKQVQQVLNHPEMASSMRTQGQIKIQQFTWQQTARNVANALKLIE